MGSHCHMDDDHDSPDRHVIVTGDVVASSAPRWFDRLTLRTMRQGSERLHLSKRELRIDEDAYIVLDGRRSITSAYVGEDVVRPLLVAFRAGSLERAMVALDATDDEAQAIVEFDWLETLHPQNAAVAGHLALIERHLCARDMDTLWWEERMALLLGTLIDGERRLRGREQHLGAMKSSTRRELLRRVLMASDFIQSAYNEPISLSDIAGAAHLSRFHLVRLFRLAHGMAPHAYLIRKRLTVALRLIRNTQLGLDEIAERTGLGTRSSLFRQLRRHQGRGAAEMRAHAVDRTTCSAFA